MSTVGQLTNKYIALKHKYNFAANNAARMQKTSKALMYPLYGCSGQRETSRFSNVCNHMTPLNEPVVVVYLSIIQEFMYTSRTGNQLMFSGGLQNDCIIVTYCFT